MTWRANRIYFYPDLLRFFFVIQVHELCGGWHDGLAASLSGGCCPRPPRHAAHMQLHYPPSLFCSHASWISCSQ